MSYASQALGSETTARRLAAWLTCAVTLAIAMTATAGTAAGAVDEGAAWGQVASPNASDRQNELAGISAVSESDVWAVGRFNSGRPPTVTGRDTLALHWDGVGWSIVPTPNPTWPGADFFTLDDVVALAPDDVWAVGHSADFASLKSETLIEHWNGAGWQIVASPNPGGPDQPNELRGVDAAGPNAVWAVGGAGSPSRPLIQRFNGTAWRVFPNRCRVPLNDVDVLSSTRIWAVGASRICRYDGTAWRVVPSPQPSGEFWNLHAVSAAAPDAAWAVGDRAIPTGEHVTHRGLIERWDGTRWRRVLSVPGQTLTGVLALARNDVWAVGTDGARGIVLHWNGVRWAQIPSPTPGESGRLADLTAAGEDHLWAAGTALNRTLTLDAPSATEGTVVGDTNVGFAVVSWFGPETGSTEANAGGEYAAPGLRAGDYFFTVSNPGCTPASANVTAVAGVTVKRDFTLSC
jgi:hypothetical protein